MPHASIECKTFEFTAYWLDESLNVQVSVCLSAFVYISKSVVAFCNFKYSLVFWCLHCLVAICGKCNY